MNNLVNFLKNSGISTFYQIVSIILNFVSRYFFLKYLGIELLGINSTIVSFINTLSLAELGFQTAITFHLYKPLEEKDEDLINRIMNIFKLIYSFVGSLIFVVGLLLIPFLSIFLKGIEIDEYIILCFILNLIIVSSSYFFSYQRVLLYADKRDFICKYVDLITSIIFTVSKIFIIVYFKSFILYLIISIFQSLIANLIINFYTKKNYKYIKKNKIDFYYMKKIFRDVKHIISAKFSNYIYSSTDTIIISSFVGTIYVGYFVNYTTIILQLKSLLTMVFNPLLPIIGRTSSNYNSKRQMILFNRITFVRYILILLVVLPTFILIDEFISIWLGKEYIISFSLVILLIIDFYISLIYAPCYEFIQVRGMFKEEEKIMIIGALLNIILSIIFTLSCGIIGVLIGTVITQLFFWISRSIVLFDNFNLEKKEIKKYWIIQFKYLISFIIMSFVLFVIKKLFFSSFNLIVRFIIIGIVTEVFAFTFLIIFYRNDENFKYLINLIKSFLLKRKNKE